MVKSSRGRVVNPKLIDSNITTICDTRDSLFLACASYEERTALGVKRLHKDYQTDLAIILRSEEYKDKGEAPKYFAEMQKRLSSCSDGNVHELSFPIESPVALVEAFHAQLASFNTAESLKNVTVDISTLPRQELLVLLRYLDAHPLRGNLRLLYVEPRKYATESTEEDIRWLTRGVKSVHAVPGFCGVQFPQLAKLLLVILGHEGERTHITLRRHQPDKVIFIHQGREQYHEGLDKIVERENQDLIAHFGSECFWQTALPAHGVAETQRAIESVFTQFRYTHNLFVAANGTKLQMLGTYLAARKYQEIQITYATPAVYNWKSYSKGYDKMWEINFADDWNE